MRRGRSATVLTNAKTEAPARVLTLETTGEPQLRPGPTPPRELSTTERIRDALLRWLEEDM